MDWLFTQENMETAAVIVVFCVLIVVLILFADS
jgi:hypothetical protein